MANPTTAEPAGRLHIVGKVALIFAACAAAGLVALLMVVDDDLGLAYGSIIGSRLRSQERLQVTLVFFGLLMAALSGLTTWLLALYASFRIAGPIWRFSRNLEQAIVHGPVGSIPLRRNDLLQQESADFRVALAALDAQYRPVREALARWRIRSAPDTVDGVLDALKTLEARVRI